LRIYFAILTGISLFYYHEAAAIAFQASGHVKTTAFNAGKIVLEYSRSFDVFVDGCSNSIRVDAASEDKGNDYFELRCDGTNVYYYAKFKGDLGVTNEKENESRFRRVNDSVLLILPRLSPPQRAAPLLIPWLAYGSHCYYSQQPLGKANLLWTLPDARMLVLNDQMQLRADWRLSESVVPFLTFYTDFRVGTAFDKKGEIIDLPKDFSDGTTNLHFEVITWTNVNGIKFPSKFQYSCFHSTPDKLASVLLRQEVGILENLRIVQGVSNTTPEISAAARVIDRRYMDERGRPFDYISNTKKILSREEALAQAEAKRARTLKSFMQEGTNTKRNIFACLIAVAIAFPSYLLCRRIFLSYQKTNKNKTSQ
jgi:hypothetical protein